jgi:hypothetical protein
MSFTPPHNTFKSRLSALARKFGLAERGRHQIFQRASQLRLPFAPIPGIKPSICWNSDPQLHRLVELPRGALSGPVQEDKSDAHALLINLIKKKKFNYPNLTYALSTAFQTALTHRLHLLHLKPWPQVRGAEKFVSFPIRI